MVEDIIGKKFGKLTVIKFIPIKEREHKSRNVLCRCDCGNFHQVNYSKLINGHTKSCGCLVGESILKRCKKYNTYDLDTYEYGVGYTGTGDEFYFDKEDYYKIKDYYWYRSGDYGYLTTKSQNGKFKLIMHRVIMNCPDGLMVDHINHRPNDNRKENLRLCDKRQNAWNTDVSCTNISGCKGVYYNKRKSRWIAEIIYDNQKIYLGSFTNKEDAITARLSANEKYQKEWSYENSIAMSIKEVIIND